MPAPPRPASAVVCAGKELAESQDYTEVIGVIENTSSGGRCVAQTLYSRHVTYVPCRP